MPVSSALQHAEDADPVQVQPQNDSQVLREASKTAVSQRTSPPEAVLPLPVPVVIVFVLVVGALANTHFDPLAAGIADVDISQINLVALRPVLALALATKGLDL